MSARRRIGKCLSKRAYLSTTYALSECHGHNNMPVCLSLSVSGLQLNSFAFQSLPRLYTVMLRFFIFLYFISRNYYYILIYFLNFSHRSLLSAVIIIIIIFIYEKKSVIKSLTCCAYTPVYEFSYAIFTFFFEMLITMFMLSCCTSIGELHIFLLIYLYIM